MKNLIRKILREQEEEDINPFNDTLFSPKFMERVLRMMDDDPDFFITEILRGMQLSVKQEINIIYNYLTQYDRKKYYIPVHFDAEELSNFLLMIEITIFNVCLKNILNKIMIMIIGMDAMNMTQAILI
jgi:hypothetical protein